MYLSVVRAKVRPDKVEAFAQKWRDIYGSAVTGMAQSQHGYCSADRSSGTVVAIWIWSQQPDETQLRPAIVECASQTADLQLEPPNREWYEILQQIWGPSHRYRQAEVAAIAISIGEASAITRPHT